MKAIGTNCGDGLTLMSVSFTNNNNSNGNNLLKAVSVCVSLCVGCLWVCVTRNIWWHTCVPHLANNSSSNSNSITRLKWGHLCVVWFSTDGPTMTQACISFYINQWCNAVAFVTNFRHWINVCTLLTVAFNSFSQSEAFLFYHLSFFYIINIIYSVAFFFSIIFFFVFFVCLFSVSDNFVLH